MTLACRRVICIGGKGMLFFDFPGSGTVTIVLPKVFSLNTSVWAERHGRGNAL